MASTARRRRRRRPGAQQFGGLERHQPAEGVAEQPVGAVRLVLGARARQPSRRSRRSWRAARHRCAAARTARPRRPDARAIASASGASSSAEPPASGEHEQRLAVAVPAAKLDARHELLLAMRSVMCRAANSSPYMKRISGPNVIAAAMPAKYRPRSDDSKPKLSAGRVVHRLRPCARRAGIDERQPAQVGAIAGRADDVVGLDGHRGVAVAGELEAQPARRRRRRGGCRALRPARPTIRTSDAGATARTGRGGGARSRHASCREGTGRGCGTSQHSRDRIPGPRPEDGLRSRCDAPRRGRLGVTANFTGAARATRRGRGHRRRRRRRRARPPRPRRRRR